MSSFYSHEIDAADCVYAARLPIHTGEAEAIMEPGWQLFSDRAWSLISGRTLHVAVKPEPVSACGSFLPTEQGQITFPVSSSPGNLIDGGYSYWLYPGDPRPYPNWFIRLTYYWNHRPGQPPGSNEEDYAFLIIGYAAHYYTGPTNLQICHDVGGDLALAVSEGGEQPGDPGDILCRFAASGWSGGVPDDCAGGAPGVVITPWLRVTGGPAIFYVCQTADQGYSRVKYTISEL
jgi:hypothetical protein